MKHHPSRKLTKFFVISPDKDRRYEDRFESRENVVIRVENTGKTFPGVAYDIGQYGLKVETSEMIQPLDNLQVAFPNSQDHIRCFGRSIWCRPHDKSKTFETGIQVHSWLGIVHGNQSWKQFKGFKPKRDRRTKSR